MRKRSVRSRKAARAKRPGSRIGAEKSSAAQRPGTVREKAAVGMGEKGRGYGGDMITMPVKAMWTAKDKIVRDQIQQALDLYKATRDAPKSHEEFMDRIIKENNFNYPRCRQDTATFTTRHGGAIKIQRPWWNPDGTFVLRRSLETTTMRLHHAIFFVLTNFLSPRPRPAM